MPMWRMPLLRASSGWWLSVVVILAVLARDQLLLWNAAPASAPISSTGSMPWRYSALSPVSKVILVVASKQRGDGDPNRVCAYLWWLIGTGYGASQGARLPAGPISPPHVVAEGRPSCFFLPAKEPIGRQLIFYMESMAWCHGSSAVPSGIVPGDDVAAPVKMSGTQLRCSSGCWGPLCKMQGPVCYLGLVLGPFAFCCVPLF
ncbi:hypothetical protein ACQJBY_022329 [Aegilops geniculata]